MRLDPGILLAAVRAVAAARIAVVARTVAGEGIAVGLGDRSRRVGLVEVVNHCG